MNTQTHTLSNGKVVTYPAGYQSFSDYYDTLHINLKMLDNVIASGKAKANHHRLRQQYIDQINQIDQAE